VTNYIKRCIFIGWTSIAEQCLEAVVKTGIIPCSIGVPRGYNTDSIYRSADKYKVPVYEISDSLTVLKEMAVNADLLVCASFPWKISKDVLQMIRIGAINVHASALPKYRGLHPLNWAIINDENKIGVSIHWMEETFDSGKIIAQETFPLEDSDTIQTVKEKASKLSGILMFYTISEIQKHGASVPAVIQDSRLASPAPARTPKDSRIDWRSRSRSIFNLVRASDSSYPAFCLLTDGTKVIVQSIFRSDEYGKVMKKYDDGSYLIGTRDGVILVKLGRQDIEEGELLQ